VLYTTEARVEDPELIGKPNLDKFFSSIRKYRGV
jgi:hypothetical protein